MQPTIAVFGATGLTGGQVARHADRYGLDVILVGRDRAKLDQLSGQVPGARVRTVDLASPASVRDALSGVQVVVNCLAPASALGLPLARAAVESGVDYLDTTGETSFCLRLQAQLDDPARERGVRLVPAVGVSSLPADFGSALALGQVDRATATRIDIGYRVAGYKPSAGTLKSEIGILADGTPFVADGVLQLGLAGGSMRRLPNGAGVRMPAPDAFIISRYCDLPEIEAFLLTPAPATVAAIMRGLSRLCAGRRIGPRLHTWVSRLPTKDNVSDNGVFTIHATVSGAFGTLTTTVSGKGVYQSTAKFAAMVASELAARPGVGGVRASSEVVEDLESAAKSVDLTIAHGQLVPAPASTPGA